MERQIGLSQVNSFVVILDLGHRVHSVGCCVVCQMTKVGDISFCTIPCGEFVQGSNELDEFVRANELPAHRVYVQSFFMAQTLVTQSQFRAVMGYDKSYFTDVDSADFPVEAVSWNEADEFCRRLSLRTGDGWVIRLPTESQWEYACRAGTTTRFNCGNGLSVKDANIDGHYQIGFEETMQAVGRTARVGSYSPNAWGLFDMHGNVWEWCRDSYCRYNKRNDRTCKGKVIRGGAWNCYSRFCTSTYRGILEPDMQCYDTGFRVCMEKT